MRRMKPCATWCGRGRRRRRTNCVHGTASGKFLLRRGLRAAAGVKSWTTKHLLWVKTLRFEHVAQEVTFLDYLHEVEHAAERVTRLDQAIDQAIESAPTEMRALIAGLQALRGIKKVSAATIV